MEHHPQHGAGLGLDVACRHDNRGQPVRDLPPTLLTAFVIAGMAATLQSRAARDDRTAPHHPRSQHRLPRRHRRAWHRRGCRAWREPRHGRRIRLRQVGHVARRPRPAAVGHHDRQRAFRRPGATRRSRHIARPGARRPHRDDLPGPGDRAQPGPPHRPPSRRSRPAFIAASRAPPLPPKHSACSTRSASPVRRPACRPTRTRCPADRTSAS